MPFITEALFPNLMALHGQQSMERAELDRLPEASPGKQLIESICKSLVTQELMEIIRLCARQTGPPFLLLVFIRLFVV
jgi:hypothetical protein